MSGVISTERLRDLLSVIENKPPYPQERYPREWSEWSRAHVELNHAAYALAEAVVAIDVALTNWEDAYPEEVFVPLTDEQQREVVALLREHGWVSDALYAHWGRHIVACLREPIRDAIASVRARTPA